MRFKDFLLENNDNKLKSFIKAFFQNPTDTDNLLIMADYLDDTTSDTFLTRTLRQVVEMFIDKKHDHYSSYKDIEKLQLINKRLESDITDSPFLRVNWSGIYNQYGEKVDIDEIKDLNGVIYRILKLLMSTFKRYDHIFSNESSRKLHDTIYSKIDKENYKSRQIYSIFKEIIEYFYYIDGDELSTQTVESKMTRFLEDLKVLSTNIKFPYLKECKNHLIDMINAYLNMEGYHPNRGYSFNEFLDNFISELNAIIS